MQSTEKEKPKPIAEQVVLQMEEQQPETPKKSTHENESTSPHRPPRAPTPATVRRATFAKTKSRFDERNYPNQSARSPTYEPTTVEEEIENTHSSTSTDDEEEDEIWNKEHEEESEKYKKKKKIKWRTIFEWVAFFVITTALVCSLTVESIKKQTKWSLEVWKWVLMVMVLFCGRLVSSWVIKIIVFFIERNFMLREKVLYFVFGLRKSFQNVIWLGLVLLSWTLMFSPDVQKHNPIFKKVFRALIGVLVGAIIWLIKIVLVKMLASSFHVATFFDRMKESVFHHYILDSLSGPPLDEIDVTVQKRKAFMASRSLPARLKDSKRISRRMGGSRKIDIEKLRKLSMESTASAWSVRRLMNYVTSSGLSTISRTIDDFAISESEITSEWEARMTAQRVFKNVAKPGAKYILEEDLLRFLRREDMQTIFPFFEGAVETGQVKKSAFRNWVVHAYIERRSLAHSLNDTKTAVQQLHKLASAIVSVVILVVFVLVMGLATSKVILLITSQLLLVGFMFQNTCKTIFEAIIFVFVMHPFDVGDRCKIDGVQMIVEEMNILTTVFLRFDKEKIYYPNSVLSTKPISNFYRSPDMLDAVDFTIDSSTSMDNINLLKKAIQAYIEGRPKYWTPSHSVIVKEILTLDKLNMSLNVTHTMNHQNFGERNLRRTELIFELKRIFETLGIKYQLLPQQIHVTQYTTASGGPTAQFQ
ncbi:hypothetical protein MKX03_013114 [Papaver bracteatum]|nr:hypothetical protein MKX03_013114 [Papaver bracteatum]